MEGVRKAYSTEHCSNEQNSFDIDQALSWQTEFGAHLRCVRSFSQENNPWTHSKSVHSVHGQQRLVISFVCSFSWLGLVVVAVVRFTKQDYIRTSQKYHHCNLPGRKYRTVIHGVQSLSWIVVTSRLFQRRYRIFLRSHYEPFGRLSYTPVGAIEETQIFRRSE